MDTRGVPDYLLYYDGAAWVLATDTDTGLRPWLLCPHVDPFDQAPVVLWAGEHLAALPAGLPVAWDVVDEPVTGWIPRWTAHAPSEPGLDGSPSRAWSGPRVRMPEVVDERFASTGVERTPLPATTPASAAVRLNGRGADTS